MTHHRSLTAARRADAPPEAVVVVVGTGRCSWHGPVVVVVVPRTVHRHALSTGPPARPRRAGYPDRPAGYSPRDVRTPFRTPSPARTPPRATPPPTRRSPRPDARIPPIPRRALALAVLTLGCLGMVLALGRPHLGARSPHRDHVVPLLDAVAVVPERPSVPGYERDCSGASACVFGRAWSDSTNAPAGGIGCSTRNDVLARDIHGSTVSTHDPCGVSDGILMDPYTGRVVDVGASGVRGIHVDHVYPCPPRWDTGPGSGRGARGFANDVDHNLVAVTGAVNSRGARPPPTGYRRIPDATASPPGTSPPRLPTGFR